MCCIWRENKINTSTNTSSNTTSVSNKPSSSSSSSSETIIDRISFDGTLFLLTLLSNLSEG
jgi:hypothetical protein